MRYFIKDYDSEFVRISNFLKDQLNSNYKKKGIVIGISGGIDSAVVASLAVKTFGSDHVHGLILPEKESSKFSKEYALNLIKELGITHEEFDITQSLVSLDVYSIRDSIVKKCHTNFNDNHKYRIRIPQQDYKEQRFQIPVLEVLDDNNNLFTYRLSSSDYFKMISNTNVKQRIRMSLLYRAAETRNYIVAGTTNKTEASLGFFVKYGDGGVDIEPLAHLYKTEVFGLAKYLEVPEFIMNRQPSPDTYSFPVSDEELFYGLPVDKLDIILYSLENEIDPRHINAEVNLSIEQIVNIRLNLESKKMTTKHFFKLPSTLEK